jgi:hypothetical protein
MENQIKLAGALMIALALLHIVLPKYFRWKQESSSLSLITRQILYVHTFFIGLVVLLMGILCIGYSHELLSDRLGRVLTLGLAGFWFTRLIFQFFVYSPELWKGKRVETTVHVLFSIGWFYFTSVFLLSSLQER